MELLSPSRPLLPAVDLFSTSPPVLSASGATTAAPSALGSATTAEETVHVAVGCSTKKGDALLRWAIEQFGVCRELVIVHVHQPSPTIPTPLGNILASRANEMTVEAFRREERKSMKKVLLRYIDICRRAQIRVTTLVTENKHVPDGIIDLINGHNIKTLAMGISSKNYMKVKRTITKEAYMEKNAPQFCEIWFVLKDKLAWIRNSTDTTSRNEVLSNGNEFACDLTDLRGCSPSNDRDGSRRLQTDTWIRDGSRSTSTGSSRTTADEGSVYMDVSASSVSQDFFTARERFSLESEGQQELFQAHLTEDHNATRESNIEASPTSLKGRNEGNRMEAVSEVDGLYDIAHIRDPKVRREIEDLRRIMKMKDKLSKQTVEAESKLQESVENIALLVSCIQEAARRHNEVTEELKKIQASILSLKIERHKIRQQQEEAVGQLRCQDINVEETSCSGSSGISSDSYDSFGFTVFSLSDLQTATCNFSESFKIGHGSYGSVYKGEIRNRSVVIKKLYPRNMQGQLEFQEEVSLLGKLKHPNIVTLLGVCPEAWSLIYEYVPNGSLQDHLSRRGSSATRWPWTVRTRAAAGISGALHFLHSSFDPPSTMHGNLKPENILLDLDFNVKISDLGIMSKLAPEETIFNCPSFRLSAESKGSFSYMDPEYRRTGKLTPKADVYAFGIILLQLITGRPPEGLAYEVRMAMSKGRLSSVLDSTAGDWPVSVGTRLAEFGLECCEDSSCYRPELTAAVVRELEQLHVLEEQPAAPNFFLCPILKEVMYDPHIAADGFTYEGKAIRGWLENGRETSPMTNLKLPHLILTPNHALRMAIRDWLAQSKCQAQKC